MVSKGVNPEILLAGGYGHKLHVWDLPKRRHLQELDLGSDIRWRWNAPAHDPTRAHGFLEWYGLAEGSFRVNLALVSR